MSSAKIPPALQQIIEDFQFCEGREKIELLIQFAENLPALPVQFAAEREKMEPVPECMTPVMIQATLENGQIFFHFDVPAESPTVRGYAALMKQGLDGSTPEDVLQIPADFFLAMGLQGVLTHQRLNGLSAILAHVKQLAARALV
jgi:cysteine desulfuration protein SufE